MPHCTDRRIVLVNRARSGRRDGFSHYTGAGGHSAESLFHQQGKAAILTWIAQHHPHVTARVEVALPGRERIADVMLTWPSGARVAVEVQYAQLHVEEWEDRNRAYLAAGVTPVWLLGHHGAQMRTRNVDGDVLVKLSVLHQHMLMQQASLMWFNPIDVTLGTPWVRVDHPDARPDDPNRIQFAVPCPPGTLVAGLAVSRLGDAAIDPKRGIVSATTSALEAGIVALDQAEEEHRRRRAREESDWRRRVAEGRRQAQMQQTRRASIAVGRPSSATTPPWTHCRRCALKLDEILFEVGYHFGCEPVGWQRPVRDPEPDPQEKLF